MQLRVEGIFYGESWFKVDCNYNPSTYGFSCTNESGKQQRVMNCWVVDVTMEGKLQHRFNIVNQSAQMVELAAGGEEAKRRWMAAIETKGQWKSRQAAERAAEEKARQEAEEQALMAKHGVSTIEEARMLEAEALQRQREEEERRRKRQREEEERRRKEAEERARQEAERRKGEEEARAKKEEEKRARQEAAAIKGGWVKRLHPSSGKQCWAHDQSGASQWEMPTAAQLMQQQEEQRRKKEEEEQIQWEEEEQRQREEAGLGRNYTFKGMTQSKQIGIYEGRSDIPLFDVGVYSRGMVADNIDTVVPSFSPNADGTTMNANPLQLLRIPERAGESGVHGWVTCTGGWANAWAALDLGEDRSLLLNHYALRSGGRCSSHLRNWRLEGSNDGSQWT
jgi:hypothetical protein